MNSFVLAFLQCFSLNPVHSVGFICFYSCLLFVLLFFKVCISFGILFCMGCFS